MSKQGRPKDVLIVWKSPSELRNVTPINIKKLLAEPGVNNVFDAVHVRKAPRVLYLIQFRQVRSTLRITCYELALSGGGLRLYALERSV